MLIPPTFLTNDIIHNLTSDYNNLIDNLTIYGSSKKKIINILNTITQKNDLGNDIRRILNMNVDQRDLTNKGKKYWVNAFVCAKAISIITRELSTKLSENIIIYKKVKKLDDDATNKKEMLWTGVILCDVEMTEPDDGVLFVLSIPKNVGVIYYPAQKKILLPSCVKWKIDKIQKNIIYMSMTEIGKLFNQKEIENLSIYLNKIPSSLEEKLFDELYKLKDYTTCKIFSKIEKTSFSVEIKRGNELMKTLNEFYELYDKIQDNWSDSKIDQKNISKFKKSTIPNIISEYKGFEFSSKLKNDMNDIKEMIVPVNNINDSYNPLKHNDVTEHLTLSQQQSEEQTQIDQQPSEQQQQSSEEPTQIVQQSSEQQQSLEEPSEQQQSSEEPTQIVQQPSEQTTTSSSEEPTQIVQQPSEQTTTSSSSEEPTQIVQQPSEQTTMSSSEPTQIVQQPSEQQQQSSEEPTQIVQQPSEQTTTSTEEPSQIEHQPSTSKKQSQINQTISEPQLTTEPTTQIEYLLNEIQLFNDDNKTYDYMAHESQPSNVLGLDETRRLSIIHVKTPIYITNPFCIHHAYSI